MQTETPLATLFPNVASLPRPATAVLMEIDEELQTERRFLPQSTTATRCQEIVFTNEWLHYHAAYGSLIDRSVFSTH
jgi:hypothetical protein